MHHRGRSVFAQAFGHLFVFAARTFVAQHLQGAWFRTRLGWLLNDGHPRVLALGTRHRDVVARLDGASGLNGRGLFLLDEFGCALLLRR